MYGKKLLTIIEISPRVVRLDDKVFKVQHSESVNNVSAKFTINVLGHVLAQPPTVPRPVGEVAHYLVVAWKQPYIINTYNEYKIMGERL